MSTTTSSGAGVNNGYPGLNGWTVELLDANGNVIATQITHTIGGVDGSYSFQGLDPGSTRSRRSCMPGWTPTTPTSVAVDTTGGSVSGIEFGDFQYVTISGMLFNDLSGVGYYQTGDPGLPGWTVELVDYYTYGIVLQTTTTDVNGNYSFTNVGPWHLCRPPGDPERLDPDLSSEQRVLRRIRRTAAGITPGSTTATSSS